MIEDAGPRRSHISRILVPEFTGRELARIRVSLELSVEEAAYLASVTTWQLKHMEEGQSNPRYRPSSEVFESVRAALHFHIMRRLKRREGVAPERRRKA
jgi:predicted transcriptional regulator